MNIFEKTTGITGNLNDYGGNLLSLLALAKDIRLKLEKKGYLLDNYLSTFMAAANAVLPFEAAEDGFEQSSQLRKLCFALIDHTGKEQDYPLYGTVQNIMDKNHDSLQFQENDTNLNLLYALSFDAFLPFIIEPFMEGAKRSIAEVYDLPTHHALYRNIVEIAGEPAMEQLNLQLKQCFLTVPLLSQFIQGLSNDLLYTLTTRDEETSKQIFQHLLDMPKIEV